MLRKKINPNQYEHTFLSMATHEGKDGVINYDHAEQTKLDEHLDSPPNSNDGAHDFDAISEKALIRKIDRRLLPILGALYSIALIDRVNVRLHEGNSLVSTNQPDLGRPHFRHGR